MRSKDFGVRGAELSESQFLAVLGRVAQANCTLAQAYFDLHVSGFADWQEMLDATSETGALGLAERLASQIKDPELQAAFCALLGYTKSLVEIDRQIIMWLAEFVGLAAIHSKQDIAKLDRRLHRIAAGDLGGPQGPVWITRPEYQAFQKKSEQVMTAVTQAKERFDQRLEQLLEG